MTDSTWIALKRYTQARIGLGRAGSSLPLQAVLELDLARALARDAVHRDLDVPELQRQLAPSGWGSVVVRSRAHDRLEYLRRPDLGRQLWPASCELLREQSPARRGALACVITDGLSALAVSRHAVPLMMALRSLLGTDVWLPVVVAERGRVALGDEIGEIWGAEQVLVLIGERPGLSAADSLGAYLTFAPRVGCTDAQRNCVSNIRSQGLSYEQAAFKLAHLIRGARRLGQSGVALKDDNDRIPLAAPAVEGSQSQSQQSQSE